MVVNPCRPIRAGCASLLKGEDWKQKYEAVKGKLVRYKKMKKVLDSLNMEAAVLARTESILEGQARNVMGAVAEEEQRAGVAGFASAQETLEQVSQVKGAIDEEKGNTLEEISHFVQKINNAIKDRKSKLAPQIKELRTVRQHFQELEVGRCRLTPPSG